MYDKLNYGFQRESKNNLDNLDKEIDHKIIKISNLCPKVNEEDMIELSSNMINNFMKVGKSKYDAKVEFLLMMKNFEHDIVIMPKINNYMQKFEKNGTGFFMIPHIRNDGSIQVNMKRIEGGKLIPGSSSFDVSEFDSASKVYYPEGLDLGDLYVVNDTGDIKEGDVCNYNVLAKDVLKNVGSQTKLGEYFTSFIDSPDILSVPEEDLTTVFKTGFNAVKRMDIAGIISAFSGFFSMWQNKGEKRESFLGSATHVKNRKEFENKIDEFSKDELIKERNFIKNELWSKSLSLSAKAELIGFLSIIKDALTELEGIDTLNQSKFLKLAQHIEPGTILGMNGIEPEGKDESAVFLKRITDSQGDPFGHVATVHSVNKKTGDIVIAQSGWLGPELINLKNFCDRDFEEVDIYALAPKPDIAKYVQYFMRSVAQGDTQLIHEIKCAGDDVPFFVPKAKDFMNSMIAERMYQSKGNYNYIGAIGTIFGKDADGDSSTLYCSEMVKLALIYAYKKTNNNILPDNIDAILNRSFNGRPSFFMGMHQLLDPLYSVNYKR